MRRRFWVILTLLMILSIAVGCQVKEKSNDYINEEYGFTFETPTNWQGKFKVIENDKIIDFVYTQYQCENGGFQEFFTIGVIAKEEYQKALNDPPMTGELLGERDGQVYIINMPLDCIILDEKKVEEYMQLSLSIDEIKERFSFNE